MKILSLTKTTVKDVTKGILYVILPGVHKYDLNHKDPIVAEQLRVLRDDVKTIKFNELLACDLPEVPSVRRVENAVETTESANVESVSDGEVPDKVSDSSPRHSKISKRRNSGTRGPSN
jgi:hypothetical protein